MGRVKVGLLSLKIRNCKTDERLKRIHNCICCGDKFYSARKTALYCSNACRQKMYRLIKKNDL
jgi:hypothetical protein